MLSTQDHTSRSATADGDAKLSKRLDIASELALYGQLQPGRGLCAALLIEHAMLLGTDHGAQQRFVECLLLLRMENLLLRLVRAVYGFDLERRILTSDGAQRTILAFPAGTSLVIPWSDMGNEPSRRARFATHWSRRILTELGREQPTGSNHLHDRTPSPGEQRVASDRRDPTRQDLPETVHCESPAPNLQFAQ